MIFLILSYTPSLIATLLACGYVKSFTSRVSATVILGEIKLFGKPTAFHSKISRRSDTLSYFAALGAQSQAVGAANAALIHEVTYI